MLEASDARREAEAEQMTHREDLGCVAFRVDAVLVHVQIGLVVEEALEDMGRVLDARVYDPGVEGRVLVGDMRVEHDARFPAVAVDSAWASLAATPPCWPFWASHDARG